MATVFLQVRAVENKVDFPTRHDWDSFFRDAKDMNETLPGERPDTIHLEGLPCRWFSQKDSQYPDRPSEEVLIAVFQTFGKVGVFSKHCHITKIKKHYNNKYNNIFNVQPLNCRCEMLTSLCWTHTERRCWTRTSVHSVLEVI